MRAAVPNDRAAALSYWIQICRFKNLDPVQEITADSGVESKNSLDICVGEPHGHFPVTQEDMKPAAP